MAQRRGEDARMKEMVKLGERNAALLPKVRNWCQYINVEMVSYGVLAEVYKLPIGRMAIRCVHASAGGVESMHLDEVASSFIVGNCRNCPNHNPLSLDTIGYSIIEEYSRIEKAPVPNPPPHSPAKERLIGLVRGDLKEALEQATLTLQSVLKLVVLLDDPKEGLAAATKLVDAARVAPEFFNDLALEVLCTHLPDEIHGKHCADCLRLLQPSEARPLELIWGAAIDCLKLFKNPDAVCHILARLMTTYDATPLADVVGLIVDSQNYVRTIGNETHHDYPGSIAALIEVGHRAPTMLIRLFTVRLQRIEKEVRINASRTLVSLVEALPSVANAMIEPLMRSLELEDDPYGDSADGAARMTLAEIFRRSPTDTGKKLQTLSLWFSLGCGWSRTGDQAPSAGLGQPVEFPVGRLDSTEISKSPRTARGPGGSFDRQVLGDYGGLPPVNIWFTAAMAGRGRHRTVTSWIRPSWLSSQ